MYFDHFLSYGIAYYLWRRKREQPLMLHMFCLKMNFKLIFHNICINNATCSYIAMQNFEVYIEFYIFRNVICEGLFKKPKGLQHTNNEKRSVNMLCFVTDQSNCQQHLTCADNNAVKNPDKWSMKWKYRLSDIVKSNAYHWN